MFLAIQLLAVLVACTYSKPLDLDFMTLDDIDRYFSVSSVEQVPEYEIVSPVAFSENGRRKRDIESHDGTKDIKLDAFGESFHMRLKENRQFLAEGLEVDRYNADGTIDKIPLENSRCYYHGKLISHDTSSIAMSTCKGLTGMIAMETHNVYIRPLTDDHAQEYRRKRRDVDNPHIIYRRTVEEELEEEEAPNDLYCGLDPGYADSIYFHDRMALMEMAEMAELENNTISDDPDNVDDVDDDDDDDNAAAATVDVQDDEDDADNDNSDELEDDDNDDNDEVDDDDDDDDDDNTDDEEVVENNENDDDSDDSDDDVDDEGDNTEESEEVDDDEDDAGDDVDNNDDGQDQDDADDDADDDVDNNDDGQDQDDADDDADDADEAEDDDGGKGRRQDDDGEGSRRKRATGNTKYLEVNVLVDLDMSNKYGANVIDYTLTLMNIVAARYAEPSLGTEVVIHIVKLGVLNTDFFSETVRNRNVQLRVTKDGPATLESFSEYQYVTNDQVIDGQLVHWDNALLISRKDLESGGSAGLLGIAWLSGTCSGHLQASYNQDIGLGGARVLAHEIGHTLGMEHDDVRFNGCPTNVNVMSGSASNGGTSFLWSTCSSISFINFLGRWNKNCLNNVPTTSQQADASDRPGVQYDADEQCRLLSFQSDQVFSRHCTRTLSDICNKLQCLRPADNACYSIVPAAEGTYCGTGKWCDSGECVTNPNSNNGNTNRWVTSLGPCSVTCGNGIARQVVGCYTSSNVLVSDSQCDASSKPTPSQQQCFISACPVWVQILGQCSVTCGQGTQSVSIVCAERADVILPDAQCPQPKPSYNPVSCNVGNCPSNINGLWAFGAYTPCSVSCGVGFKTRDVECVQAENPSIIIDESFCDGAKPTTATICNDGVCVLGVWRTSGFADCSVTCGGGTRRRDVTCQSSTGTQLPDSGCLEPKPSTSESCNQQNCATGVWVAGSFSDCTVTCGGGTRTRDFRCQSSTGTQYLPDSDCLEPKPSIITESCNQQNCATGVWKAEAFSDCSATCGGGIRTRQVTCRDSTNQQLYLSEYLCQRRKPTTTEQCNINDCQSEYFWIESSFFGPCTATCGGGVRSTLILCVRRSDYGEVSESLCDDQTKPQSRTEVCNTDACVQSCAGGNCPDEGEVCAGLYTHPASNLDRIWPREEEHVCKEGIVAPIGQSIKLTFTECNIHCNDGSGEGYVLDGSTLLNFCCYGETFSWTSTSNVIQIAHKTSRAGHGYRMKVEFVGQPEVNGCNRIFTSATGTITSQNYPSYYPTGQSCQYYIIAPPGKRVDFAFADLSLHTRRSVWPWLSPSCTRNDDDNLEIINLTTGGGIRYCGTHTSNELNGLRKPELQNRVLLHFRSNRDAYSGKGFNINYTVVDA